MKKGEFMGCPYCQTPNIEYIGHADCFACKNCKAWIVPKLYTTVKPKKVKK